MTNRHEQRTQVLTVVAVGWLLLGLWVLATGRPWFGIACLVLAAAAGSMAWRDRRAGVNR